MDDPTSLTPSPDTNSVGQAPGPQSTLGKVKQFGQGLLSTERQRIEGYLRGREAALHSVGTGASQPQGSQGGGGNAQPFSLRRFALGMLGGVGRALIGADRQQLQRYNQERDDAERALAAILQAPNVSPRAASLALKGIMSMLGHYSPEVGLAGAVHSAAQAGRGKKPQTPMDYVAPILKVIEGLPAEGTPDPSAPAAPSAPPRTRYLPGAIPVPAPAAPMLHAPPPPLGSRGSGTEGLFLSPSEQGTRQGEATSAAQVTSMRGIEEEREREAQGMPSLTDTERNQFILTGTIPRPVSNRQGPAYYDPARGGWFKQIIDSAGNVVGELPYTPPSSVPRTNESTTSSTDPLTGQPIVTTRRSVSAPAVGAVKEPRPPAPQRPSAQPPRARIPLHPVVKPMGSEPQDKVIQAALKDPSVLGNLNSRQRGALQMRAIELGIDLPAAMKAPTAEQRIKIFKPVYDARQRVEVMQEDEKRGNEGDAQADMSMVANHLAMTLHVAGGRVTRAAWEEAKEQRPWLQGIQVRFEHGFLTGVSLSPEQRRQMVELAQSTYLATARNSASQARALGIDVPGDIASAIGAAPESSLPPEARSKLKEGVKTTFANGQVWTLRSGVPTRLEGGKP